MYLFLAVLGLSSAQTFFGCGKQGLLFVAVHRLCIGVAPLISMHGHH